MLADYSPMPRHSALAACRLFESTDVDDTREKVSQVMQPHDLMPIDRATDLRAHMDYLRLPGMGIGSIKFGHMRVNVEAIEGYHLLLFCLSGNARIRSEEGNEFVIDSRNGIYLPPGAPLRAKFSADCEQLVMRVDDKTWRAQAGSPSARLRTAIDLSRPELQPWVATVSDIISVPQTIKLIMEHESVARSYERLLLDLLFIGQGMQDVHGRGPAPAVVTRAEKYLRENVAEPLRLEDVALAIGVPSRTLLVSFQRFRETSPMRFLRDLRLDRARAELDSKTCADSVTNVALDCGFTHFGRFSQYYAQRFGESPSETLARKRRGRFH